MEYPLTKTFKRWVIFKNIGKHILLRQLKDDLVIQAAVTKYTRLGV